MVHTPEPWAIYKGDALVIVDEKGSSLGEMVPGDPYIKHAEAVANAARIVACINACAGIPTDKLRPGIVKELRDKIAAVTTGEVLTFGERDERMRVLSDLLRELGSE